MAVATGTGVVLSAHEGRRWQVLQDRLRVLVDGGDTGGAYEIFELSGPEGSGPPLHSHPWDEAYFVLEGRVELTVALRRVLAEPGHFALAPAGTPHTYRIASPQARFLVFTSRAGAGAFFAELDRAGAAGGVAPDELLAVAARHGVQPSGAC